VRLTASSSAARRKRVTLLGFSHTTAGQVPRPIPQPAGSASASCYAATRCRPEQVPKTRIAPKPCGVQQSSRIGARVMTAMPETLCAEIELEAICLRSIPVTCRSSLSFIANGSRYQSMARIFTPFQLHRKSVVTEQYDKTGCCRVKLGTCPWFSRLAPAKRFGLTPLQPLPPCRDEDERYRRSPSLPEHYRLLPG
jgi:hypothetical protein